MTLSPPIILAQRSIGEKEERKWRGGKNLGVNQGFPQAKFAQIPPEAVEFGKPCVHASENIKARCPDGTRRGGIFPQPEPASLPHRLLPSLIATDEME